MLNKIIEKVKKINKKVIILVTIGVLIIGGGYIGLVDYTYYSCGKDNIEYFIEDRSYGESIEYLLLTLNEEECDGGLDTLKATVDSGKIKNVSLNENRGKFDYFRKGLIAGLKEKFENEKEKGLYQMIADDENVKAMENSDKYNELIQPIIDKYNDEYIEIIDEYEELIELIQADFKDEKLDDNYEDKLEEINNKYEDFTMDIAQDISKALISYIFYNIFN